MNGGGPRTILYLCTSGQVGGAERSLLDLCGTLDRRRFSPRALVGSPGPLLDLLLHAEVPAALLPLPGELRRLSRYHANSGALAGLASALALPGYLRRLARAIAAAAPSLIHSNGIKMHLAAALLPGLRPPLLWHLRDFPPGGPAGAMLRACARRPALLVANSQAVADAYNARSPALAPRLRVVHNGVDTARFAAADGRPWRHAWGWSPSDRVVGMVAVLAPWKGHEVFLRAAARALALRPDLKFVLVGDNVYDTTGHGGRRGELDHLARQLGLGAAVRFAGQIAGDIAPAYAALDIMVHASTRPEPFGRTLIEAMAARVAVIASAGGGVLEIIRSGEHGLLTPPGDPEALAQAILRLAGDDALRLRLAAAGAARAQSAFSSAAHAAAIQALYAGCLPPEAV